MATSTGQEYYNTIKQSLEDRWSPEYHQIYDTTAKRHKGVPKDANKFGLKLIDWENTIRSQMIGLYNKMSSEKRRYEKLKMYDMQIPFQYMQEMPIQMKAVTYGDEYTMGRFEQQTIYSYSNAQDYSLNITYLAESSDASSSAYLNRSSSVRTVDDTNRGSSWTLLDIERCILKLQSLVYPQYDGNFAPPYKLLMNIGNVFIDQPIVIRNVNITNEPPFEINTMQSMLRKVTLEIRTAYPPWQAISASKAWTADNGSVFAFQKFKKIIA